MSTGSRFPASTDLTTLPSVNQVEVIHDVAFLSSEATIVNHACLRHKTEAQTYRSVSTNSLPRNRANHTTSE